MATIFRTLNENDYRLFASKTAKDKAGSLYANLDFRRKVAIHYATFYYVRRLVVALLLCFMPLFCLKVHSISITCYVAIYYLLVYKPFELKVDNRIELTNEICFLVINEWNMVYRMYHTEEDPIPEEVISLSQITVWCFGMMLLIPPSKSVEYFLN